MHQLKTNRLLEHIAENWLRFFIFLKYKEAAKMSYNKTDTDCIHEALLKTDTESEDKSVEEEFFESPASPAESFCDSDCVSEDELKILKYHGPVLHHSYYRNNEIPDTPQSPEKSNDEDFDDEQEKNSLLQMFFITCPFPTPFEVDFLAHKADITRREVEQWFSDQRKRRTKPRVLFL